MDHTQPPLHATITLKAAPALVFAQALPGESTLPGPANSFTISVDVAVSYDMLANAANGFLAGRRFNLNEGFLAQHIVVQNCRFMAANGKLAAQVAFTGSLAGSVFLTGRPVFNPSEKTLVLQDVSYEIETNNLLLKGAKWIFNKIILDEIKKHADIDVSTQLQKAQSAIESAINKTWMPGLQSSGTVTLVTVTGITPAANQLVLHTQCNGTLQVTAVPALLVL